LYSSMTNYRLFSELADRYDWHTPPEHYDADHQFVIRLAREYGSRPSLLDVGCGTGAFIEKARSAGIDARGIDASAQMIVQCERRLGAGLAIAQRMEDIADSAARYDVLCCLSWTLHYAQSSEGVYEILKSFHRLLRPGGTLVLQLAHAPNATGQLFVDREDHANGSAEDVALMYRFVPIADYTELLAQYVLVHWRRRELFSEDHVLRVTNAHCVSDLVVRAGFQSVQLFDSWKRNCFEKSVSPFLIAKTPA
jgi:SAM-dependent methyltransferase